MRILNAIGIQPMPEMPFPRCLVLDEWLMCTYLRHPRPAIAAIDLTPEDFAAAALHPALVGYDDIIIDLEPPAFAPWLLDINLGQWPMEYVLRTIQTINGWLKAFRMAAPGKRVSFYQTPERAVFYRTSVNSTPADDLLMRQAKADAIARLGVAENLGAANIDLQRGNFDAEWDALVGLNVAEARKWGLKVQAFYGPLRSQPVTGPDGRPTNVIEEWRFAADLYLLDELLGEDDELVIFHPYWAAPNVPVVWDRNLPWVGILTDFAVNRPWPMGGVA